VGSVAAERIPDAAQLLLFFPEILPGTTLFLVEGKTVQKSMGEGRNPLGLHEVIRLVRDARLPGFQMVEPENAGHKENPHEEHRGKKSPAGGRRRRRMRRDRNFGSHSGLFRLS
jgi:hypothetical protein